MVDGRSTVKLDKASASYGTFWKREVPTKIEHLAPAFNTVVLCILQASSVIEDILL